MKKNTHDKFATFASRYGQQRVVTQTADDQYTFEGPSFYLRVGGNETIEYVDFEGGPMISLGDKMTTLMVDDKRKIVRIEMIREKNINEDKNYSKVLLIVG
jgi:hypothetical protein